jgi:hypothetical protein
MSIDTIDANFIRTFAAEGYVKPALKRGESTFSIPVKVVEAELKKAGLPIGRTPLVCSALRGKKFQEENKILLDHWDGPPSGQSTTVVFHYRVAGTGKGSHGQETPAERAFRLTEKLRGIMKEEIASHGGAEGFIRWVRSDEDDAA